MSEKKFEYNVDGDTITSGFDGDGLYIILNNNIFYLTDEQAESMSKSWCKCDVGTEIGEATCSSCGGSGEGTSQGGPSCTICGGWGVLNTDVCCNCGEEV